MERLVFVAATIVSLPFEGLLLDLRVGGYFTSCVVCYCAVFADGVGEVFTRKPSNKKKTRELIYHLQCALRCVAAHNRTQPRSLRKTVSLEVILATDAPKLLSPAWKREQSICAMHSIQPDDNVKVLEIRFHVFFKEQKTCGDRNVWNH